MQGKLIIGALLLSGLGSASAGAAEQPQRQTCSKDDQQQLARQSRQRPQQLVQQPRNKPQGCPVTRAIPSVVDPTPTFLL